MQVCDVLPSETSAFALADGAPLASCAAAFSADLVRLGVRVGVRLRLRLRVGVRVRVRVKVRVRVRLRVRVN